LIIIVYSKSYTESYADTVSNINCPTKLNYSDSDLIAEVKSNAELVKKTKSFCFCKQLENDKGLTDAGFYTLTDQNTGSTYKICYEWLMNSAKNQTLTGFIIVIITLINIILEYGLKCKKIFFNLLFRDNKI
jgi:hypothetical protein